MSAKVRLEGVAWLKLVVLLGVAVLAVPCLGVQADEGGEKQKIRLFELRIYTCHPGKLPALHKRFREHTNKLFVKHGMELVGYWTPTEGPEAENTLVYMLAYPSREAREKSWKAFVADPQWKRVFKQSHEDAGGRIVKKVEKKFLTPTDYSPMR